MKITQTLAKAVKASQRYALRKVNGRSQIRRSANSTIIEYQARMMTTYMLNIKSHKSPKKTAND